ncbi:g7762 [Coccomyxa viridis]|uniref:G7762 protein n=1 Tax=Coccomyxa viridis TaxID=1274662 RepID=A0ABP1G143_9CHLO
MTQGRALCFVTLLILVLGSWSRETGSHADQSVITGKGFAIQTLGGFRKILQSQFSDPYCNRGDHCTTTGRAICYSAAPAVCCWDQCG